MCSLTRVLKSIFPLHFRRPCVEAGEARSPTGGEVAEDITDMDASDIAEVNEFEVPKDTLGLHVLYEPERAADGFTADIIAVHGLGGDSFSTWTEKASGKLWLKDFLPHSEYFRNSRIMTFGYDARPWLLPGVDPATAGRTFTFSESLLTDLRSKRILTHSQGRPIIFFGHSLGGIVIKNALVLAQARRSLFGDIYKSTKAITFFSTPHQGADVAAWTRSLEGISKIVGIRRSNVLRELETWSPALLNLSRTFCDQIPRLLLTSFFEKQPYNGIFVVNEGSAALSYVSEIVVGLNANHKTICKFSSEESANYKQVIQQLETRVYEISNTPEVSTKFHETNRTEENRQVLNPSCTIFPGTPTTEIGAELNATADAEEEPTPDDLESLQSRMKALKK